MAKQQRGGQVTHGAVQFWSKGILPKGQRKLAAYSDEIIQGIIIDLGGPESITVTQGVLLGQLKKCLIFQMIVDRWLAKPGREFIDAAGNLPPVMSAFYLAVMNNAVRFCLALGLKRVSPADDLESYLKRNYGKGKAKDSSAPVIEAGKPLTKGTSKKQRAPQTIVDDSGEVNHE